jgi:hypothetical protein
MKHQHHFETTAEQTAQARALIVEVYRTVQILNSAISAEQDQAEVYDHFPVEYPTHVRTGSAPRQSHGYHRRA